MRQENYRYSQGLCKHVIFVEEAQNVLFKLKVATIFCNQLLVVFSNDESVVFVDI